MIFFNLADPNMVINIELVSLEEIKNIWNQENLESSPVKGLYKKDVLNHLVNNTALIFWKEMLNAKF